MQSNPKNSQDWAYDFAYDGSLETLLEALDRAAPWSWSMRENYIEGSYLNCRPGDGTRIKINEHPQGFVERPGQAGFSTLLRTDMETATDREELDRTLVTLLEAAGAREFVALEPYD